MEVSTTTIRRVKRNELGWKSENARYCQFVREPNKMKRLVFSLNAMVNKDLFEDVIFTDETSMQIEQHARMAHNCHGKIKSFTAKANSPRQKQIHYGKSKFTTAKANSPRQKQIHHGKSKFTTAKANHSRQKANWSGQNKVKELVSGLVSGP